MLKRQLVSSVNASELCSYEILLMKQRVAEMEAEAEKLRQLQAAAEAGDSSAGGAPMETEDDKTAADSRSVYAGNVSNFHFNMTPIYNSCRPQG